MFSPWRFLSFRRLFVFFLFCLAVIFVCVYRARNNISTSVWRKSLGSGISANVTWSSSPAITTSVRRSKKVRRVLLPIGVKKLYGNAKTRTDGNHHEVIRGSWRPRPDGKTFAHVPTYAIANAQFCSGEDIRLLVFVESAPRHFAKRLLWRETWGSYRNGTRVVYVIARDENEKVDALLRAEQEIYEDLIQFNYTDTYESLSRKTLWTLIWIGENCRNADFILKTDDDVTVQMPKLVGYLRTLNPETLLYAGRRVDTYKPLRQRDDKWLISYEEYPFEKYPVYVLGFGAVFSRTAVSRIVAESRRVELMPFEDVFVGQCAELAGVKPTNMGTVIALSDRDVKNITTVKAKFRSDKYLIAHGIPEDAFVDLWKSFVE